jgi:hypothetical protein
VKRLITTARDKNIAEMTIRRKTTASFLFCIKKHSFENDATESVAFQKSVEKYGFKCGSGMRKPYRKISFRPKDNSPSFRHFTHGNLLCRNYYITSLFFMQ